MAELALERLENASVAGTDFRAKRQPKETKANREEFELTRLQLRELQPDFDTQLGLLMAETFFVVKTIAQVKVLERLKMEGWRGKAMYDDRLGMYLRNAIKVMLCDLNLYKK